MAYKIIWLGDIHGPKLYKFTGLSDIHCPKPYKFIRFGDIHAGQTLRDLKLVIYLFIFLRSAPQTQIAHEWDLELVSGAEFWLNLHCFSSRGRSRGSRGLPWAPSGRKSANKTVPDLSFYLPYGLPRHPPVGAKSVVAKWGVEAGFGGAVRF